MSAAEPPLQEPLRQQVDRLIKREAALIAREFQDTLERACEVALLTGYAGVMVTQYFEGGWTIAVDARVPYGYIYSSWDARNGPSSEGQNHATAPDEPDVEPWSFEPAIDFTGLTDDGHSDE